MDIKSKAQLKALIKLLKAEGVYNFEGFGFKLAIDRDNGSQSSLPETVSPDKAPETTQQWTDEQILNWSSMPIGVEGN